MMMLAGNTPKPASTVQNFCTTATRAMFLDSMAFTLMATFVAAQALLDLKMAFQAASAVVWLASCMAMASMFACSRAASTAAFSRAKVMFAGVFFTIFVSTHATTRMLLMLGLTANVP